MESLILAGGKGARKGLELLKDQEKQYLGMDIKELNEGKGSKKNPIHYW